MLYYNNQITSSLSDCMHLPANIDINYYIPFISNKIMRENKMKDFI